MLNPTDWVIAFLVTYYITTAIVDSTGPLWIFDIVREGFEDMHFALSERGYSRLSKVPLSLKDLLECFICASLWVALLVVFLISGQWLVIESLAVAGLYVMVRQMIYAVSTGEDR